MKHQKLTVKFPTEPSTRARDTCQSGNLDVLETSQARNDEAVQGVAGQLSCSPALYCLCASTAQSLGRQPYRPAGTKHITLDQAANIIEAVQHARAVGRPLVAHLTIHWFGTDAGDDPDGKLFAKVREGLNKWLLRRGLCLTGVWSRERRAGGQAEVLRRHHPRPSQKQRARRARTTHGREDSSLDRRLQIEDGPAEMEGRPPRSAPDSVRSSEGPSR